MKSEEKMEEVQKGKATKALRESWSSFLRRAVIDGKPNAIKPE
jgi:hypothetical protein